MNSQFANLFLAVQTQIAAVASVKHVDQDLGQFEDERPPVTFPAVLIDVDNFIFSDAGENIQLANGQLILRIGFPPYSASSNVVPTQYKQSAINYYDIEYAIHAALQGWSPGDAFGKLDRVSARTEKRTDNLRVRIVTYSIAFEDYDNAIAHSFIPATMDLTTEFVDNFNS
jgi:hypothetical protein